MKKLRSIPKVLKINEINGYVVSPLFNTGESGIIDFKEFFKNISPKHPASKLAASQSEFNKIEIIGNTIGWKNAGIYSKNLEGETVFYHYDIDPIVLFEKCVPDDSRNLKIGSMIKTARKKAGMTQEELAKKSGTSKHYISRLETGKSDIELLTLKKIIEAGLGKELLLKIT